MKNRIEPTTEEGQRMLGIWQSITSKPLTSRELDFAMAIASVEREACAKLAESINDGCIGAPDGHEEIAAAIRLRHNAEITAR
jgi:hypothetical protein